MANSVAVDIFVGREQELTALRKSLEDVIAGRGHICLVVGEPGIGKTRLAHEFATDASQRGAHVLIGRCYEGEGAPPFWLWYQILRTYIQTADPQTLRTELGGGAVYIAQVIAEVRAQCPDLPPAPQLTFEQGRFPFFDSVTTFLQNAAKGHLLVLILDDSHWADMPSLLLLQFVARELGRARLLIIGTYRDLRLKHAHPEFASLTANDCADIPHDVGWLLGLTFLSHVCVFLHDTSRAATLCTLLFPYARRNLVVPGATFFYGAVSRSLGLLAPLLARWDEAEQHFADALDMHTSLNARPFVAHTQYEYARMMLARGRRGDQEKARTLLEHALATAQKLEMKPLVEKIVTLRGQMSLSLESGPPLLSGEKDRVRGQTAEPPMQRPSPHPSPAAQARETKAYQEANVFRREGTYWTLPYQGHTCRLRNAKGLQYLATLLHHPEREFHVAELVALTAPPLASSAKHPSVEHLRAEDMRIGWPRDAGTPLDAQGRAAYKRRLEDLHEELEEAERFNDPDRAAKARVEIDFLTQELTAAYGVRGQARRSSSEREKIRKAVTNAMRTSLTKIRDEHPALWRHLFSSLKTGTFCSYNPEQPTTWEV